MNREIEKYAISPNLTYGSHTIIFPKFENLIDSKDIKDIKVN